MIKASAIVISVTNTTIKEPHNHSKSRLPPTLQTIKFRNLHQNHLFTVSVVLIALTAIVDFLNVIIVHG